MVTSLGVLKSRDPTSRDLTTRHHIARVDITRPDNVAPYCKGGHRETCFSFRVDAHYKFMFDSGSIIWAAAHRFYHVCSSISFCFTSCYVRQTKLASSLDNVWAHYKIVIVWLTDRSISKSFLCHHCVVLYTVYVFYVRTAPVQSQHVAPQCTLRPRLLLRLPLPIPTPLELALLAQLAPCLFSSSSSLLLLLLLLSTRGCRDSVWAPTEWLTARRTTGDYKRRCRIGTNRI